MPLLTARHIAQEVDDEGHKGIRTMKRIVKLRTSEGSKVRIFLENWGSGMDQTRRRWTLEDGYWQCLDSRETAQESGLGRLKVFGARSPVSQLRELVGDGHRTRDIATTPAATMRAYSTSIWPRGRWLDD